VKPNLELATTRTPDGGRMVLYRHDRDYSITVDGRELMNSRQHESEQDLARLGCAHLADHDAPRVLIGGLGMGYTLREALDLLAPRAEVVVGEFLAAVVKWNRTFFGELNRDALTDERVSLESGNVIEFISRSTSMFDSILLDIDNGPGALTHQGNRRLYTSEGIDSCRRALRSSGCLAVWSVDSSKPFESRLMSCGFHVRRYRVKAHKGGKSRSRFVWVASENESALPPGGGAPRRGHSS
jgi:spermidine synthase